MGTTAGDSRRSRPLRAFGSLAGNRGLLRVLVAYLTSQDLQWLVDTQPTVKARIAASLAERLQNR